MKKKTTIWKAFLLAGVMALITPIVTAPVKVTAENAQDDYFNDYYTIEQTKDVTAVTKCLINDSIDLNTWGIRTAHWLIGAEDKTGTETYQDQSEIHYSVEYDTKIWDKLDESENGLLKLKRISGNSAEVTVIAEKNFDDEEHSEWIGVAYKTYKFQRETEKKETVDVSQYDVPFCYELNGNKLNSGYLYTDGKALTVTLAPDQEFPDNVTVEWRVTPEIVKEITWNQTKINQVQIKWSGSEQKNIDSLELTAVIKADGEEAISRTEKIAVYAVSVQKDEEKPQDVSTKKDEEKTDQKEKSDLQEKQDSQETQNKELTETQVVETEKSKSEKRTATIHLTVNKLPLQVKKTVQLSNIITDTASGDYIVSCTSSKPKVAAVNRKGKVTAKSTGSSVITIRMASGATAKVTIRVQKKAVAVSAIKNISKTWKAKPGEKKQLKPVIYPVTAPQKVTYQSSNKKVATVSKNGKITAKKAGTAKITVKAGKKKCTITVKVSKRK